MDAKICSRFGLVWFGRFLLKYVRRLAVILIYVMELSHVWPNVDFGVASADGAAAIVWLELH